MANKVITNLTVDGAVETSGGTVSSGIDTQSGVALTVPKGSYIKSDDGNYLRNIIGHNSSANIELGQSGTSLISDIQLKPGSSGNVSFFTTGSESFRVDSSGRVGIGTTAPTQRLEVIGTIKQKAGAGYTNYVQQSVSEAQLTFSTFSNNQTSFPSAIKFAPNGSEAVRIDNAGQVGIGTTSPNAQLTVGDGTINSNIKTFFSDGAYTEVTGYGIQFDRGTSYLRPTGDNNKNLYIGSASNTWATVSVDATSHSFNNNGASNMFIDAYGDVGIGTTSPTSSRLNVKSNGSTDSVVRIDGNDARGASRYALQIVDSDTNGRGSLYVSSSSGASAIFQGGDYISHSKSTDTNIAIAGRVNSYPSPSSNSSSILTTRDGGTYPFNSYGHLVLSSRHNAARDILFRTNDTDRAVIQGGGNVGIGTTSPAAKLHVNGDLRVGGDGSDAIVHLVESTDGWNIRHKASDNSFRASNVLGGTDHFNITQTGEVGIGTTSPSEKLHVNGNVQSGTLKQNTATILQRVNPSWTNNPTTDVLYNAWTSGTGDYTVLRSAGNTTTEGAFVAAKNGAYFGQHSTTGTITDSSTAPLSNTWAKIGGTSFFNGNVGIGTTSPSQKLDVNGNVNVSGAVQVGSVIANGSSFDVYIGGVRVMTIDSSGNAHFKGDVTGNSTTV